MKKLLVILFYLISISLNAAYYVSTTGNDSHAGTISSPWLTWDKAFATAVAGDTVYFRGGVYPVYNTDGNGVYYNPNASQGHNGTMAHYICYFNYPGETPILDCAAASPTHSWNYALRFYHLKYIHIKGLTIRNVRQTADGITVDAFTLSSLCAFVTVENCNMYNIGGIAYMSDHSDTVSYINCDAHDCCDSLSTIIGPPPYPYQGNYGTGFTTHNDVQKDSYVTYYGCRAWHCSDQGFVSASVSTTIYDRCWAFSNGAILGDGHGFKLGYIYGDSVNLNLEMICTNCLAAYNRATGITTNDHNHPPRNMHVYNNIAYHNGFDPTVTDYGYGNVATGFDIYNTTGTDPQELLRVFKNNISFGNDKADFWIETGAVYTHTTNSWDGGMTVTAADFASLDSTGLTSARGSHGQLPKLTFLHLASTSDGKNAGVNVSLIMDGDSIAWGSPPSLGAFEYVPASPPIAPTVITTTPGIWTRGASSQSIVASDGGGTVSARGICWSTSANPTTSDGKTYCGTGTGTYTALIVGLLPNITYHIRAYATNETATAYGADVSFTTPNQTPVGSGTKIVVSGKMIVTVR